MGDNENQSNWLFIAVSVAVVMLLVLAVRYALTRKKLQQKIVKIKDRSGSIEVSEEQVEEELQVEEEQVEEELDTLRRLSNQRSQHFEGNAATKHSDGFVNIGCGDLRLAAESAGRSSTTRKARHPLSAGRSLSQYSRASTGAATGASSSTSLDIQAMPVTVQAVVKQETVSHSLERSDSNINRMRIESALMRV